MTKEGKNVNNMISSYEDKLLDVYGVAAFRKFDDHSAADEFSVTASMRDVTLARLGETYLIAAEALIRLNDKSGALSYINEVRGRAKATPAVAEELNIDYLLRERARELAGEYHRWTDLKRTGKLAEYATKYNPEIYDGLIKSHFNLRPIPYAAIELNPALEGNQNPGY